MIPQSVSLLLVDDKPASLLSLEAILGGLEYHLVKAGSGEEALQQLLAQEFALILLAVRMPGLDGFETARLIRARESSRLTPIIFLTAEVKTEELIVKGYSLGAVDYLVKPLVPELLRAKVQGFVERKQIADALRRSEQSFRHSLESSPDGTVVVDCHGRVVFANTAATRILGRPQHLLQGTPFGYPMISGRNTELEVVNADGRRAIVEMRLTQTLWQGDSASLVSLRDITHRKNNEQQLLLAGEELHSANQSLVARNAEIQQFYHTLSHELKTPLTSAREFIAILIDGLAGPLNATQLEYLGIAKESCAQLRLYINDLLDVTRLETGKMSLRFQAVPLAALVERVVEILAPAAAGKGIRLSCDCSPNLPDVPLDPQRIQQVLTNLTTNAIKFTPARGEIHIRVSESPAAPDCLQVAVRDTGRGIPADQLDLIFNRLHQARGPADESRSGLGLGLYICQELVCLHGGCIRVASELGRGATFTFTIPKRREPTALDSNYEA